MNKRQKKKAKRKEILRNVIVLDSFGIWDGKKRKKRKDDIMSMAYAIESLRYKILDYVIKCEGLQKSSDEPKEPVLECFERWRFKTMEEFESQDSANKDEEL